MTISASDDSGAADDAAATKSRCCSSCSSLSPSLDSLKRDLLSMKRGLLLLQFVDIQRRLEQEMQAFMLRQCWLPPVAAAAEEPELKVDTEDEENSEESSISSTTTTSSSCSSSSSSSSSTNDGGSESIRSSSTTATSIVVGSDSSSGISNTNNSCALPPSLFQLELEEESRPELSKFSSLAQYSSSSSSLDCPLEPSEHTVFFGKRRYLERNHYKQRQRQQSSSSRNKTRKLSRLAEPTTTAAAVASSVDSNNNSSSRNTASSSKRTTGVFQEVVERLYECVRGSEKLWQAFQAYLETDPMVTSIQGEQQQQQQEMEACVEAYTDDENAFGKVSELVNTSIFDWCVCVKQLFEPYQKQHLFCGTFSPLRPLSSWLDTCCMSASVAVASSMVAGIPVQHERTKHGEFVLSLIEFSVYMTLVSVSKMLQVQQQYLNDSGACNTEAVARLKNAFCLPKMLDVCKWLRAQRSSQT